MDSTPNTIEFSIKRKTDMKIILMRAGIIAACYLPSFLLMAAVINTFFVLIPVLFFLASAAAWFLMRFTMIEYEYSIISGEFSVAAIYNNRQRKTLVTSKIKDMHAVVPYENKDRYVGGGDSVQKIFYYCSDTDLSSKTKKDLYVCVINDAKYGKCAVVFNATRRMVQIMKFYNSQNVIMKDKFWI